MRYLLYYLLLVLFFAGFSSIGQSRIVINNDAYITMSGGSSITPVYLVVDNPNTNAITTAGSGGNLISGNEFNKVRWNIGTNSGLYTLPFTTGTGTATRIPYIMNITTPGTGGTHIDFSTFPTTVMNMPRPTMVTHMLDALTATIDNSMWVIDRFWVIDAMNYATRPAATMIFNYDPTETGGNSLVAGNMKAQRFDSDQNEWSGSSSLSGGFYGNDILVSTRVENVNIPSDEFYEAWTLTDRNNILPVDLTFFNATCEENYVELNWTTASETNASHFEIQKSEDGFNWTTIGQLSAQGATSNETEYNYRDYNPSSQLAYYRLRQVDFDGVFKLYDAQSVYACQSLSEDQIEVSALNDNQFQLNITASSDVEYAMEVYAITGQKVMPAKNISAFEGKNIFLFDGRQLSQGIYIVHVFNEQQETTQKIFIK